MFLINETPDEDVLLSSWGCKKGSFSDTYLGAPLGACFKNTLVWTPLLEKLRERLAAWKRRYITEAGRLVLVKSTLASMPVYLFSMLVVPCSVREEIEKIARDFLWGSTDDKRKIHWLNWREVCISMSHGGLGIQRLRDVNIALLCKWLWRIRDGRDALWKRIILGKYGAEKGGWATKKPSKSHGCGMWKGIMSCSNFFCSQVHFVMGKGDRISFWEDKWLFRVALQVKFPNIYAASRKKKWKIREMFTREEEEWKTDLGLRARLNNIEREEQRSLLELLQGFDLLEEEDSRTWLGDKNEYKVRDTTTWLEERFRVEKNYGQWLWPKRKIWGNKSILPKASFLMWAILREKTSTADRLREQGRILVNRCCFCKCEEENNSHLFNHCPFTKAIWKVFESTLMEAQAIARYPARSAKR